jgi:hypothetical protein
MAKYPHDLSIGVSGKVGQVVYQRVKKGRGNIPTSGPQDLQLRAHVPQTDARTPAQLQVRARLAAATAAYQVLPADQRAALQKQTQGKHQTGFNLFVQQFCRNHELSEY